MTKPSLNLNLLYNSDQSVQFQIVSQILKYIQINLSTMGSRVTRDDFIYLCRLIMEPHIRAFSVNYGTEEPPDPLLGFTPGSGVIRHLKAISGYKQDTEYPLLRLVYLAGDKPTS